MRLCAHWGARKDMDVITIPTIFRHAVTSAPRYPLFIRQDIAEICEEPPSWRAAIGRGTCRVTIACRPAV